GHDRQAELLDAEGRGELVVAVPLALLAARLVDDRVVGAELGLLGNGPLARRGAVGAPAQRQLPALVGADVHDDGLLGPFARRQSEAFESLAAQEVLHAHGLPGAQQRAVEDGAAHGRRAAAVLIGQLEAPRLDALAPRV